MVKIKNEYLNYRFSPEKWASGIRKMDFLPEKWASGIRKMDFLPEKWAFESGKWISRPRNGLPNPENGFLAREMGFRNPGNGFLGRETIPSRNYGYLFACGRFIPTLLARRRRRGRIHRGTLYY